jgi:HK97 family phage portal protein
MKITDRINAAYQALIGTKAKPRTEAGDLWTDATVRPQDEIQGRYNRSDAAALVQLVSQYSAICGRINAMAVSSYPIRLMRKKALGQPKNAVDVKDRMRLKHYRSAAIGKSAMLAASGEVQEVEDHPLLDLLRKPNPWTPWAEFVRYMILSADHTGNFFVYCPDSSTPAEMYQLAPQYVRTIPNRETFISGYAYGRSVEVEETFAFEDVIHGKLYPSLINPYLGEGCLHAVVREAQLQALATENEIARWLNGGRPSTILKVPETTGDPEMRAIESYFNSRHRGPQNAGKVYVARAIEAMEFDANRKDMEYIEGQKQIQERVWNAYGVPQSLLQLNDANLASSVTGHTQYARQTILPRQVMLAEVLGEYLLPAFGLDPSVYWLAFDNPVPEDMEAIERQATSLVATGVKTINELRSDLGYAPLDGGDVLRINGMPIDQIAAPLPVTSTVNANVTVPDQFRATPANPTNAPVEPTSEPAKSRQFSPILPDSPAPKSVMSCTCACTDASTKAEDPALRLISQLAGDMRIAIGPDIARMVESAVNSAGPAGTVTIQGSLIDSLASTMLDQITGTVLIGAQNGLERIGREVNPEDDAFSVIPTNAIDYYSERMPKLAGDIGNTLAEQVRGRIVSALEQGSTIEQIKSDLLAEVPDITDARAEAIARTETSDALNNGERLAWQQAGIQEVQWELAGGPCPICEAVAAKFNKPHPIGTPFFKLGESISTASGPFTFDYKEVQAPPAHPNCRCTLIPIVEGDE